MKIYIDMEIVIVILLCAILLIFNWIIASQNESIEKKIDDLDYKIENIKKYIQNIDIITDIKEGEIENMTQITKIIITPINSLAIPAKNAKNPKPK